MFIALRTYFTSLMHTPASSTNGPLPIENKPTCAGDINQAKQESQEYASSSSEKDKETSSTLGTHLQAAPQYITHNIRTLIKEQRYLLTLKTWKFAALQNAQTTQEANAITEATQKIERWVANKSTDDLLNLHTLNLKDLPELPFGLKKLNVSGNLLNTLPNLPDTLEFLDAQKNLLTTLENFPETLKVLHAANNQFSHFPKGLPTSIEEVNLRNNDIIDVPEHLPSTLKILILDGNLITYLPDNITALGRACIVDLGNIPLPAEVYHRLRETIFAPNYQGPRFYFSRRAATHLAQPLENAVCAWYPEKENTLPIKKRWEKLGTTRGANDFSLFLDRLRDSLHFHQDEFKFAICTWLNKLADDAELRTLIFAVAQEGVGSCEDRAQLTLNTMHTAAINLDVTRAQYDTQLDQLLACARVMFRLQTLENIARKKAATLPLVDEIEVYLAYQVKLRTQLDLPIAATMRFFEVSHVTQDDLDTALLQIKHKEEMEFLSYLSTDWGPWQTVLHRLTPSAYQILQETISDTVDHDFKTRQTHFLQSNNIDDNEYNRAKTTQTVLKNIAYEINNEFTLSFLSERNIKI